MKMIKKKNNVYIGKYDGCRTIISIDEIKVPTKRLYEIYVIMLKIC